MDYLTYMWTNMVYLFYTTYISEDLAHHEIFRAKVVKGGKKIIYYNNKGIIKELSGNGCSDRENHLIPF